MAAVLWLIAGVLLIAAEVLSGELVLAMLGAAALVAAGSAALGAPLWIDVALFALTSLALVSVARPVLKRRLTAGSGTITGTDALIGSTAVVVSRVDASSGQVKLRGEVWTARPLDDSQVLEPGRTVTVMNIAGATAIVWGD